MSTIQKTKFSGLSIIIPCFNEAENVGILLDRLQALMAEDSRHIEVIVVDGASTDDTPYRLQQRFETLNSTRFKLILQSQRGGYGHDIMAGLACATGDVLAWTHADLQTDVRDVLHAFDVYSHADGDVVVKGRRRNRPLMDVFFTFGMQVFAWCVLGIYLRDINAQPKLFSHVFYSNYLKDCAPSDFSLDLFLMVQAHRYQYPILTIPVYFNKRLYGEAKGGGGSFRNKWQLIVRTVRYIYQLKKQRFGGDHNLER